METEAGFISILTIHQVIRYTTRAIPTIPPMIPAAMAPVFALAPVAAAASVELGMTDAAPRVWVTVRDAAVAG